MIWVSGPLEAIVPSMATGDRWSHEHQQRKREDRCGGQLRQEGGALHPPRGPGVGSPAWAHRRGV